MATQQQGAQNKGAQYPRRFGALGHAMADIITDMTPPSTMSPVGRSASKLLLRLPPTLHERIRKLAADEGVSVNTMIATLLAGGVGFTLAGDGD